MKKTLLIGLFLTTALIAQQNMKDRTPPQEAISICEGKSQGDTCSMTSPRGDSVEGTCMNTPDNKYFACKPENMGKGKPQRR